MSLAKKCDRCGKFYESYNMKRDSKNINGIMFLNLDDKQKYYAHGAIDLCPECTTELMKWFKKE